MTTLRARALTGSLILAFCIPAAASGQDADEGTQAAAASASDALFEFHSSFWLNLHHFLYEQAVFTTGDSTRRMPRNARAVKLDALSGYERSAIKSALGFYRDSVIELSLLFNRRMGELDRELGMLPEDESVIGKLGWRNLEDLLGEVAPIYAAYWWAKHDKANEEYISTLEPLIDQFGSAIAAEQSAVLQVEWPEEPIRVDVVEFANWAGAYTHTEPTYILVSSTEGQGDPHGNLETVFHEAGHGMISRTRGPVSEAMTRAFEAADKEPPRSLWHPLLFYTVGEIVRDQLEAAGVEDFVPYADRYQLYSGEWAKPQSLLLVHWPAYMAGDVALEAAAEAIAGDW